MFNGSYGTASTNSLTFDEHGNLTGGGTTVKETYGIDKESVMKLFGGNDAQKTKIPLEQTEKTPMDTSKREEDEQEDFWSRIEKGFNDLDNAVKTTLDEAGGAIDSMSGGTRMLKKETTRLILKLKRGLPSHWVNEVSSK